MQTDVGMKTKNSIDFIYKFMKRNNKAISSMTKSGISYLLNSSVYKLSIHPGRSFSIWKHDGKKLFIYKFAVSEEYQGTGEAKRLMKELIDIASKRGYESINLVVKRHNTRAIMFYMKMGFEKISMSRTCYDMALKL